MERQRVSDGVPLRIQSMRPCLFAGRIVIHRIGIGTCRTIEIVIPTLERVTVAGGRGQRPEIMASTSIKRINLRILGVVLHPDFRRSHRSRRRTARNGICI